MCREIKLGAVAADGLMSLSFRRDVADDLDVLQLAHYFVGREGNGKEQFIILSPVEGACGYIHVELFCHGCSLIVERNALLVDATSHMTLGTDVKQFAAQSVADVY